MMRHLKYIVLYIILFPKIIIGQFVSLDIIIDDRLLRSDEKQKIINLNSDIKRFFLGTVWDDNYSDLEIPLHIQIVFEGVTQKGNINIYNCQALFSNGNDLRYFDKSFQFYYNSGSSIYYDPVLFEPLVGFLAFYGHLILGNEIDTYEFNGGNKSFEMARDIALRGSSSDYKKGWDYRIMLVDNLTRNIGLRKARLAWYIAIDLYNNQEMDLVIEELNNVIDGIEQSFNDVGRNNQTQFFLKIQSNKIAEMLVKLGQIELLEHMYELDSDRRELYQSSVLEISE